jgi:general secretion pathway protein D
MALRIILSLITAVFLISSCASKKDLVAKGDDTTVSTEDEFSLPETEPQPTPKPAERKSPLHLEPVLFEKDDDTQYILLNFENTDIKTIISTFSELLEINYILTPGISGSVTIQSYKKFPVKDLFQIFQSILQINGLTALKEGAFYKIVPIESAKQYPIDIKKGAEEQFELDPTFITQLLPLENVKASDIANILRNLMPRGTDIIIYEPSNMLIVTALPATLTKFMKIIEVLDIPETETENTRTFVYYVENGEAKNLEKLLKDLYSSKKKTTSKTTAVSTKSKAATIIGSSTTLPSEIGDVTISAYNDINALIIKAAPRSYLSLLKVLKRIDVPPKQVMIEVMIVEITLTDEFQFGLEWLVKSGSGNTYGFSFLNLADVPPTVPSQPGGTFGGVITGTAGNDAYSAVLGALAIKSKLNMLASPHILAMDNKEAMIEIGDEVPIATGLNQQPSTGGTSTTLVSSGQIQYKTVGTILKVTPRITEGEMVTMKISQEQSQLGAVVQVAGQGFQGFSTRTTSTTATVKSGHTLVLGGLIRETASDGRSGIPFLSKIPLLGYLFSSSTDTFNKTELILLVTPRVISSQKDADELTSQYQNRVITIKEKLDEAEQKLILEETSEATEQ